MADNNDITLTYVQFCYILIESISKTKKKTRIDNIHPHLFFYHCWIDPEGKIGITHKYDLRAVKTFEPVHLIYKSRFVIVVILIPDYKEIKCKKTGASAYQDNKEQEYV